MRRREFIAGLGGAAAWPLAARALQGAQVHRIGVLMPSDSPVTQARYSAFRKALVALGWIENQNLHIEVRYPRDGDQISLYAAELVRLAPRRSA
jgi:putative ABC transport system substrate-binding protein